MSLNDFQQTSDFVFYTDRSKIYSFFTYFTVWFKYVSSLRLLHPKINNLASSSSNLCMNLSPWKLSRNLLIIWFWLNVTVRHILLDFYSIPYCFCKWSNIKFLNILYILWCSIYYQHNQLHRQYYHHYHNHYYIFLLLSQWNVDIYYKPRF